MRRFATDRVAKVMEMVGMEEDMPLESNMVSRFIEQAQTKVEGYNFDIRKNVVDYDDVIAEQRKVIYADRRAVLERADMHERILDMIRSEVSRVVDSCIPTNMVTEEEQLERLFNVLETWVHIPDELVPENVYAVRREELKKKLIDLVIDHYEEQGRNLARIKAENPDREVETLGDFERLFTLQVVDRLWMDHIDALDVMRSGIHLRSIGQRDPLVEFKNEAFRMFEDLKLLIQHYIVDNLLRLLRNELILVEQRPAPKRKIDARSSPRNLRTNADDIAKAAGQAKSDGADGHARSAGRSPVNRGTAGAGARHHSPNGRSSSINRGTTGQPVLATQSPRPIAPGRIGRNDPCPCGSGKKYKKCHGA
jgi:preprotein translocase subunit SecA